MRQFSMFQLIPQNILFTENVHRSLNKLKKGKSTDWETKHAEYIHHWNDRVRHYVDGVPTDGVIASIEYMNWYWDRTVIHVVHPIRSQGSGFINTGGRQELFMEGFRRLHHEFANLQPGNAAYEIPQQYMDLAGASHYLHIQSMHYSAQHDQFPGPPPQPVNRARRQRPRRGPHVQPQPSFHEGEGSGSYHPEVPMTFQPTGQSTFEAPGPSTFAPTGPCTFPAAGPSTFEASGSSIRHQFDLNVGLSPGLSPEDIFNLVDDHDDRQYITPPRSQSFFPSGFSSPLLPQQPMRDNFGLQSRDVTSPVSYHSQSMFMTPDVGELMDVQPEEGSWRLVRDRVPRERRPRGPCLTGDRHSRPSEDGDGAN